MHHPVAKETTQLFWQLPDQSAWLREAKSPAKEEQAGWLQPVHSDGRQEQASSDGQTKGPPPPPGELLGGVI